MNLLEFAKYYIIITYLFFLGMMDPSHLLLNHPAELRILSCDLMKHFCPDNLDCYGDTKECWNYFYEKSSADKVYCQDFYMSQDPRFPDPYIDTAISKLKSLGEAGWYPELRQIADTLTKNRNPNHQLLDEIRRFGKIKFGIINIGTTCDDNVYAVTMLLENELLKAHKDGHIIPALALRVFGLSESNGWFHSQKIPHKIVISDGCSIYIEINLPTRETAGGTILHKADFPKRLNELFELLKPEKGLAILLTHEQTADIEAAIAALRSLTNGDQLEFPGYLDVTSLWIYLGKYTVNTDLSYMFRLIVGGTLIMHHKMEEPNTFMFKFDDMHQWAKIHLLAIPRAIVQLFFAFVLINFDRILPDPGFVQRNLSFGQVGAVVNSFIGIIAESMAYVQFDADNYYKEDPNVRYRCIQPAQSINQDEISIAWLEYCNVHTSKIFYCLEQYWPWNRPLIVSDSWQPNTQMDTRWLRIILDKDLWYSSQVLLTSDCTEDSDHMDESYQLQTVDENSFTDSEIIDDDMITRLIIQSRHLQTVLKTLSADNNTAWFRFERYLRDNVSMFREIRKRKDNGTLLLNTRKNYKRLTRLCWDICRKRF